MKHLLLPLLALLAAPSSLAQCPNNDSIAGNSAAQATLLPPGAREFTGLSVVGVGSATSSATPSQDWFRFTLQPSATGTFEVVPGPGQTSLYIQIYTASGSLVQGSNPSGNAQPFQTTLTSTAAVAEDYLVRIVSATGPCRDYAFRSSIDACPGDDAFENFDDCDSALALPNAPTFEYSNLTVRASDEDWFETVLAPGERLDVDVTFTHSNGDIDLVLRDAPSATCGAMLALSDSLADAESVTHTNNTGFPQTVRFGVYLFSGACNRYALDWSVTAAPADDALEENDTICTAVSPGIGEYDDLRVFDADPDFHRFDVGANERGRIRVDFTNADGDLDLRLWDVTGGCSNALLVEVSNSVSDLEEITFTNGAAGLVNMVAEVYYFPSDGGFNDYDLTLAIGPGAALGELICVGNPNSTGGGSLALATGSDVVANNDFTLECYFLPTLQFGFFSASQAYGVSTNPGGSAGDICIAGGPIGRLVAPGQIQNSGSQGFVSVGVDLTQLPLGTGVVAAQPGDVWYFQFWHRDLVGGQQASNFSSAIRVPLR